MRDKYLRKKYIVIVSIAILLLTVFFLKPSYDKVVKEDHLETCVKVRYIIAWRFGTIMQEYIKNGDFSEDNPDYGKVLRETVKQVLGEKTSQLIEEVNCDRSDMKAEFILPNICREGGTIKIYVMNTYDLYQCCSAEGHEEPIY